LLAAGELTTLPQTKLHPTAHKCGARTLRLTLIPDCGVQIMVTFVKNAIVVFPHLLGSAEARVICGIVKHLLIT